MFDAFKGESRPETRLALRLLPRLGSFSFHRPFGFFVQDSTFNSSAGAEATPPLLLGRAKRATVVDVARPLVSLLSARPARAMYTPRKAGTPGQRRDSNYPTPGRNSPPSPTPLTNRQTRRRIGIPFVRTRIHPLFLIPVFLVGAYFSPFKGPPELVYTGPAYQDHYGDATYLPPDAPPLAADGEEELGVKRARILKGKAKKVEDIKVQQQDEEEEGEYWDFSYQDDPADAPTSTPHLVERDGYLYYPTSVPLVDMVIPKAQRLRSQPAVDPLKHLGSLAPLVAPPPPPPYHPPGSAFLPKAPRAPPRRGGG